MILLAYPRCLLLQHHILLDNFLIDALEFAFESVDGRGSRWDGDTGWFIYHLAP